MFINPSREERCALFGRVRIIAVVGLSAHRSRPSHEVAHAMHGFGYRVSPVPPGVTEVLGERAYARLADVPLPIDLVNVFRSELHAAGVVDDCLAPGMKALWI